MPNARSCSDWRLYVILDPAAAAARELAWIAERAIQGGADAIQLRHKTGSARELLAQAAALLPLARRSGVPLIINDRPDIAVAADADGVHLGQDDLPVDAARRLIGPKKLIGKSTHSLEQAREADGEAVDYLAIGPVYATPTKPDYGHIGLAAVRNVAAAVRKPLLAIGGIDASNASEVAAAGVRCVAVVRAVCSADDPETAANHLKHALLRAHPEGSRAAFPA